MVVIVGGTGFVGGAVARQVASLGEKVRVVSRGTASGTLPAGMEFFPGSIHDTASLAAAFEGASAVINCAGIIVEKGENTFLSVHTEGTRHILEAMKATGVRRLVHISALGTKPTSGARYHRSKWRGEELVRASGLDWTILKPSLVFGKGDHFANMFAQLMQTPVIGWVLPVFGDGNTLLQPVSVDDVAEAAARALANPVSVGRTYDVCGPKRLTLRELYTTIAASIGHTATWYDQPVWKYFTLIPALFTASKPILASVPWVVAYLLANVVEAVFPCTPPVTVDQVTMLEEGNVGDPAPAVAAFGLKLRDFATSLPAQFAA